MVSDTANTAGDQYMQKARQHASNSKADVNAAGQHAASAASTVGHDLRAAGQQAADAARYVGSRLTAPVAGEDHPDQDVKGNAKSKADAVVDDAKEQGNQAVEEAKTTYGKIKNSIGNFFAGNKSEDATGTGAAHKAADKVNKGLDKAQEKQQDAYESASGKEDVKEHGQQALDSAREAAIQTKDTVVGGLSYVKGRLTAPVSGEEGKDEELKERAKEKSSWAADKVRDAAQETKEQSKGIFSSIRDAFNSSEKMETDRPDDARRTARSTLEEAQDKMKDTVESAKASLRDAAEAVEPKTAEEAIQAQGGIPSNTADLLKGQEFAQKTTIADHEDVEGKKIGATDFLRKTAEGWGGDNLTGEGSLSSVRDAADQAGPHSRMK